MIKSLALRICVVCMALVSVNCYAGFFSGIAKLFSHSDDVVKIGAHTDDVVKVGSHSDDVARGGKELIKHGGKGGSHVIASGKTYTKKIKPSISKNSKEIKVPKGLPATIMAGGAAVAVYNSSDNISKPVGEGLGEIAKTDPEILVGVIKIPITIICTIITVCLLLVVFPLLKALHRICKRIARERKPKQRESDVIEMSDQATSGNA